MQRSLKKYQLLALAVAIGACERNPDFPKSRPEFRTKTPKLGVEEKSLIEASIHGDLKSIISLIKEGADINQHFPAKHGPITPLLAACISGHINVVQYLLYKGAEDSLTYQGYRAQDFYHHKQMHRSDLGGQAWPTTQEAL